MPLHHRILLCPLTARQPEPKMNKGSGIVPIPSTRSATKTVASMQQRVVSPKKQTEDIDNTLRPRRLIDYIGQEGVKGNLEISITAARQRGEALDHVLLYGPPGLGKTTLANIVATELGVRIKITSGPAIERPGDMVATLTQLKEYEVLFIDEIHRLSRVVEEVLYPAMEDFFVSWVIDKGLKARSMNLAIKPFTLIGATTRYGMISAPNARPLRCRAPSRILRRRCDEHHRQTLRAHPGNLSRGRRPPRNRQEGARHSPDRKSPPPTGPRLRPGRRGQHHYPRRSTRGARSS